ncbi:MAG: protein kinase [Phycisphaerales bacterium]|nr:protein kinase [Phycisphaerales bacterium]
MPDTPSSPTPASPSDRDRELAEQAVGQARQRPGSSTFGVPPAIPADSIPGYEILREIHRGGQGVVYQAIQKSTRRKVAIKVVREGPFSGPAERARFEREVQVLGQLNHPNIVAVHDSGEVAGSFYFAMDYISGQSLDAWARMQNPSIDAVLRLFATVCEAVSAAHLRGVIHRDLKPGNIRVDAEGQPHILDFGLAKLAGDHVGSRTHAMTLTGQFIGSLPWASPEQAGGTPERIDIRTDVYSLGVVLYQLLTGRFPYDVVGNMRDVLDNILKAEPARPSTIRRQINDEIETIVLKCLSKERERRYQSAGELGRDIHRYLAGEPIEAKRDSGWYVIAKTLRRYRPHVAIAASFLMLLLGAGTAATYLWLEARQSEREARRSEATARAESRRAAENLSALRTLARAVLDADEPLRKLRGTTPIREAFARTTPDALGLVEPQAADDPAYLRELAMSWDKYGDVLAALFQPNTGDHARARDAYGHATQIRQRLLREYPDRRESHTDMAESHIRAAQLAQAGRDYATAREAYDRAIAELDQALSASPAPEALQAQAIRDRRATIWTALGDAIRFQAQAADADAVERLAAEARDRYAQAERYWSDRLRAAPTDHAAARWIGVCRDNTANLQIMMGQAAMRRSAADDDPAAAAQQAADAVRRYDDAVSLAGASLEEFDRLSRQFPENAEWRRDIYLAHHTIGLAHQQAGQAYKKLAAIDRSPQAARNRDDRFDRAARSFAMAVTIASALSASDESNVEARRDLAVARNKAGNMLRELGKLSEASAQFEESLAIRAELDHSDPTARSRADLAVGLFKCAEVDELRGDGLAEAGGARQLFASAARRYAESLAIYLAQQSAGTAVSASEIAEVRACLDRVQRKLGGPQGPE